MSKSENNSRRGLPPSRRSRGSSLPRKKVSPDGKHISRESDIGSRKKGSKAPQRSPEEMVLEEVSVSMPGGEFTLLNIPTRKPLPQLPKRPGRKCILEEIVNRTPDLYARLIGMIRIRVSANVAAMQVGINESTFWDWSTKGGADASNGVDSYFARFHEDIRRATAYAVAESEQEVNAKSPERYLNHGMGRIFGVGKQKNRKELNGSSNDQGLLPSPSQSLDDVIDATFTVTGQSRNGEYEEISGIQDKSDQHGYDTDRGNNNRLQNGSTNRRTLSSESGSVLILSPAQEAEALGVLASIGQISVDLEAGSIKLSEELKKAFQDQLSK